jgi:1,4-dihydroxy-2-naphthoate octaprenyltransferase
VSVPSTANSPLRAWLLASRPRTLPAAWTPVVVATALAWRDGVAEWLPALAALVGATFIQIGTNFANDYYDFMKGADTAARVGPTRVTQSGLIAPPIVLRATVLVFALAFVVGIYLVSVGGWPIVWLGLASLLCGWAYTGGPYPLGYNGLGDVFVLLFFGFGAMCGTYWVQALTLSADVIALSVPVGALATAIIVVNNLRDADTDVHAGKRTLAVRFGKPFVRAEYVLLLALAFGIPLAMAALNDSWFLASPLLCIPLAIGPVRSVLRDEGPVLNATLGATARLLLIHGVLLSLGLVGAGVVVSGGNP